MRMLVLSLSLMGIRVYAYQGKASAPYYCKSTQKNSATVHNVRKTAAKHKQKA